MILLLNKLGFSHHRRHCHGRICQVNLASLHTFQSLVSENLNRVFESLKLGSEFLSLTWIHQCFKMVAMLNIAFAKLMVEIDYPVGRWEASSIDEYLDYTINLLHLLNSISSSVSHVNHARVSLVHALSLMESSPALAVERMIEIKKHDSISIIGFKTGGNDDVDRINWNEKEWVFHEAMMVLRRTGFWVCGVVLSGLKGEVDPIIEMIARYMVPKDSSLMALDSMFRKRFVEEGGIVKEVERVNESVGLIVSSGIDGGMELKRRLEVVGNGLMSLKEEEECVFRSIMDATNEVVQTLRKNNN